VRLIEIVLSDRRFECRSYGIDNSGKLTAEALKAQSKEFLIKKYSDLCELRVSVVNFFRLSPFSILLIPWRPFDFTQDMLCLFSCLNYGVTRNRLPFNDSLLPI
jgi:hypothetical protein